MCGRFYVSKETKLAFLEYLKRVARGEIKLPLSGGVEALASFDPHFDVRPTHAVPVLAGDGLSLMRWGFQPGWADKIIINATCEKLGGRFWKRMFSGQRGLVPAAGWYEWTGKTGSKQAHALHTAEPTALGAVWLDDAEHGRCFAVVTAPAAAGIAGIHTRMPVLVPQEKWAAWLTDAGAAQELAATFTGRVDTFQCAAPARERAPVSHS